jgi:hypothetical protein
LRSELTVNNTARSSDPDPAFGILPSPPFFGTHTLSERGYSSHYHGDEFI